MAKSCCVHRRPLLTPAHPRPFVHFTYPRQTITQIGTWDADAYPVGKGTWITSAGPGVKYCPKATAFTSIAATYTDDTNIIGQVFDKYTIGVKGTARLPVAKN